MGLRAWKCILAPSLLLLHLFVLQLLKTKSNLARLQLQHEAEIPALQTEVAFDVQRT